VRITELQLAAFGQFHGRRIPLGPGLNVIYGLNEAGKLREGFLPAEVAHLDGNGRRDAFLHYGQFRSAGDLLQRDRREHFPRQVWVVELIGVTEAFIGQQFAIGSAKAVGLPCCKVCERHSVGAADFDVHMMNPASKAIWRKPLGHCLRLNKCPIDPLRIRTQYTVKSNGSCGHGYLCLQVVHTWKPAP
jgi:hypothetical protein